MLLMKLSHFIAGAQVRDLYDRSHQGQVLTPTDSDGIVEVRWDDGTIYTVDGDELRVVDPAAEAKMVQDVQAKLDEATSAFESAFKAFQDAKDLVVDDSGLYDLQDESLIDLSKLEDTINKNGWSVSSLYC